MRRTLAGVIGALLLVAAGCGGATEESSTDTSSEIETEAPETESTEGTEEAEEGGANAVAVELPGLPIGGGSTVVSATLQCVDVSWSGPPDLPPGWGITVTGVGFDPASDFALSGETCPTGTPPCTASGVLLTSDGGCHVAVTWTQPNTDGGEIGFTRGIVTCPPDRAPACESFLGEVESEGAQTIPLEPSPEPEVSSEESGSGEVVPEEGTGETTGESSTEAPDDPGATDGGG